jgi:citrate synthase
MKKFDELYLSAREASAELAISQATLYAYVSRGLIRSEPSSDSRNHRYRAEDVRRLKERRVPSPEPRGLRSFDADLPVMDSTISTITEDGPIYRGVNCVDLAEKDTLEHAATLLWDVTGVDPFAPDNCPSVSDAMRAIAEAARRAAPIDRAIAVLALAASADPRAFTRAADGRAMVGARMLRLVVATMLNTAPSAEPVHLQIANAWTSDNKHAADLIRRSLVLLADHELNASTFTVRCAASTGLNLYDAVIAGLAALKGPKHGGASVLASRLVKTLVDHDVAPVIRERVALGERFAGFGHGVYKRGDPRAMSLLDALARAGAARKFTREIPERIAEATGEFVNIDYALAVLVHSLRLPPGSELALFAMARSVGWIAHASEQLQHGGLIRPRARYIGPAPGRSPTFSGSRGM